MMGAEGGSVLNISSVAGLAASDFRKTVEAQTPLGRIAQPEDIARAIVFFASDDAG